MSSLVEVPAAAHSGAAMDRVVGPPRHRRIRVAALALAIASAAAGLAWAYPRGLSVPLADVQLATVVQGRFEDVVPVRATAVAAHSVVLDAVDGGRVEAVGAADGALVHAGDLLLRLSNPQREQEVLARTADVAQQLSNLSVQRSALAADRAALRRELAGLRAEEERATAEARRTQALAAQGFVSPAAAEDAERRRALQARLAAQAQEDGEAELRIRERSVDELGQAVHGLQAGLSLVREAAAGLAVRAPIAGRLAGFAVPVGAGVRPGDRLGRIDAEDGGVRLQASVDELYRPRLSEGLPAYADVAGRRVPLVVGRVDPQVVQGRAGVSLDAAASAPEADRAALRALGAGQGVDAWIALAAGTPALVLEAGAADMDTGGMYAYVVSADGRSAERRPIRTGRRAAGRVEVLGGLAAGERVIVSSVRRYGDAPRLKLVP